MPRLLALMRSCVLLGLGCHLAVGFCSLPSVHSSMLSSFLTSGTSTLWTFCYSGLLATLVSLECFSLSSQNIPLTFQYRLKLLITAERYKVATPGHSATLLLCLSQHLRDSLYTGNKNKGNPSSSLYLLPLAAFLVVLTKSLTESKLTNVLLAHSSEEHRSLWPGGCGTNQAAAKADNGIQPRSPFPLLLSLVLQPIVERPRIHGGSSKEVLFGSSFGGTPRSVSPRWPLAVKSAV